jgi:hypothetical protein
MVALTAVRDRDDKVCSAASGLTMKEELEGAAIVGYFHLHRGICSLMDSRLEET